jgi:hypothetical protein
MIERTAKKVANSRAKSLRTDRYRLFLYGFIVNYFNFVYQDLSIVTFHMCRVMASIKDSNEAQKKDEPQEV